MCVVRVYKVVIVALTMIGVSSSQNCSLPTNEDLENVIKLIITYAEEIPYSCNAGYDLIGTNTRTC